MLRKHHGTGVRCVNCGAWLEPGDRCDCERQQAQKREAEQQAKRRAIIAHNRAMMERAYLEYDYS